MKNFRELFTGFSKRHGLFIITGDKDGKKTGRASTVEGPVVDIDIEGHIKGEKGIGIVPLLDDNISVDFGVIDIDIYDLDFNALEKDCKQLPVVITQSKSKGAHVWLFLKEPTQATLVQDKLREWAAHLGYGGSEIFPKQCNRVNINDVGNWINLPYFGEARLCFKNGNLINVSDFVALANSRLMDTKTLEAIKVISEDDFKDCPPCLQTLTQQGPPPNTRNIVLFNIATYFRQKYPDDWKDKVVEYNIKKFPNPLSNDEVQRSIKSNKGKDYFYQCKQSPLCQYCNKAECLKRKFGVGSDAEELPFMLNGLTKIDTEPPIWYLNVDTTRIEIDEINMLSSQHLFKNLVMERVHKVLPRMSAKRWDMILQDLLNDVFVQEAPDDASIKGQQLFYIKDFIERSSSEEKDRLMSGNAWIDKDDVYFRSPDILKHLKNMSINTSSRFLWALLRDEFKAEKSQFNIKGSNIQCWKIQLSKLNLQTEPFSSPDIKDPFKEDK